MPSRRVTASEDASFVPFHPVQLDTTRIEVRLTRAEVKSRLFGRPAEATRIGRFVVLSRVGTGGMGVVYAAYDPELDRRVALKVMRADVVPSHRLRQQDQLLREARSMAKLSHPNVVTIYDAGVVNGQVFAAMEFVPSQTLRQWLEPGRTCDEILRVFLEAGQGLSCAHAAGLVHCDFKPENVLVPAQGPVRVTDFGLARAAGRQTPNPSALQTIAPSKLTAYSVGLAGTPAYMAPEQMRGDDIDARADQWAFCVALYEALAGHRPFDDTQIRAIARGTPLVAPPLPPDIDVPSEVRDAIARGLSFDRDHRFTDQDALHAALRPRRTGRRRTLILAAVAVIGGLAAFAAWPDGTTCPRNEARLRGTWDRATRAAVADQLRSANPRLGPDAWQRIAPALDAYAARWLDLRQRSCRATDESELSPELFDLQIACFDERLAELSALVDTLRQADSTVVAHAVESAAHLTPLESCLDPKVLRDLTPPPAPPALREASREIRERVRHARALRRSGKSSEALELLDAAVSDAERLDEPVALVEAQLQRGMTRATLALREGAAEDFDMVVERGARIGYLTAVADAAVATVDVVGLDMARHDAGLDMARVASVAVALAGDDPFRRARLKLARGRVLYQAGRTDEATAQTQAGLDALAGLGADPRARLEQAAGLRLLAKLALAADDPARAARLATRAITIFEDLLGPTHPEVGDAVSHLAAALLRSGDAAGAKDGFERAAQIQRAAYGASHPAYGRALANQGSAEGALGHAERALALYQRSLAILEQSLGSDDPRVAAMWVNIGAIETDAGRFSQAEAAYARGLDGLERGVGRKHPQTALALANLARLALRRGDPERGYELAREALAIRREVLGDDHIETTRSQRALGDAQRARGDLAAAHELYAAAIAALLRIQAPAAELAEARLDYARTLADQGIRAEARRQIEQALPAASPKIRAEIDRFCAAGGPCPAG